MSATAALFEGHGRGRCGHLDLRDRMPPTRSVGLHVHPYAETFLLLEGRGHWTLGDGVVDLEPEQTLIVRPDTRHGLRNIGDVPLLVVGGARARHLAADLAG